MRVEFTHLKPGTDLSEIAHVWNCALWAEQIKEYAKPGKLLPQAATICTLRWSASGDKAAVGYAFCSRDDQFSKKRGRLIAEGRARKRLERMHAKA